MRLLALLLVAFIGLVRSQQGQGRGHNFPDQGRAAGGSSQGKKFDTYPNAPVMTGQNNHFPMVNAGSPNNNFPMVNAGSPPQQGGSSRGVNRQDFAPWAQQGQGQGQGHNSPDQGRAAGGSSRGKTFDTYPNAPVMTGQNNHFAQVNAGSPPQHGGSSRGVNHQDFAPAVAPGPINGNVNHVPGGSAPPPGGSSRQTDAPLGPVQNGVVDRVNMVNAGGAPTGGNSGQVADYGYGAGIQGNAGAANTGGNSRSGGGNNQVGYGAGGNSGGNGGPAFAAGPYSDNAGAGAPLGGALMNDLTQQEAGNAEHVSGGSGPATAVAGVVVAVLVLVGIVAVAAVFLVRQRQARMTIASV